MLGEAEITSLSSDLGQISTLLVDDKSSSTHSIEWAVNVLGLNDLSDHVSYAFLSRDNRERTVFAAFFTALAARLREHGLTIWLYDSLSQAISQQPAAEPQSSTAVSPPADTADSICRMGAHWILRYGQNNHINRLILQSLLQGDYENLSANLLPLLISQDSPGWTPKTRRTNSSAKGDRLSDEIVISEKTGLFAPEGSPVASSDATHSSVPLNVDTAQRAKPSTDVRYPRSEISQHLPFRLATQRMVLELHALQNTLERQTGAQDPEYDGPPPTEVFSTLRSIFGPRKLAPLLFHGLYSDIPRERLEALAMVYDAAETLAREGVVKFVYRIATNSMQTVIHTDSGAYRTVAVDSHRMLCVDAAYVLFTRVSDKQLRWAGTKALLSSNIADFQLLVRKLHTHLDAHDRLEPVS